MTDIQVSFVAANYPSRNRNAKLPRGAYAKIATRLMKKPKVWAKISATTGKPLPDVKMRSLSSALHAGARFGLAFEIRVQDDGHTYARYVGPLES